jgi:hypothetical protein
MRLRFGDYTLDTAQRVLFRAGTSVTLERLNRCS